MRYLVGFVVVVALAASPLTVSAQAVDEDMEPTLEEPEPSTEPAPEEPAPEEPALELKLDDAGVEVAPPPPRTPDGYTLEEMELRVKRARTGLIVSAGVYVIGLAVAIPGAVGDCGYVYWGSATPPARCDPLLYTGSTLTFLGFVGMITSGVMLHKRKRDRNWLRQAQRTTPRRVQWDLARSRLVF
ncbi:MAG: hypothetical protein JRG70_18485 [Deltaproteobacteria bacterium]|nr:hypothetical protein [Deltaproteobacteria bacterium]